VRAARSVRRPKIAHGLAADFSKHVVRPGEFIEYLAVRSAGKIRMRPCMVADDVAGFCNSTGKFPLCLYESANHEERGKHIVLCEHIEEARRPRGIGTVIERQRKFARFARRNQSAAEDLRRRIARSVREAADPQASCSSEAKKSVNTRCQRR